MMAKQQRGIDQAAQQALYTRGAMYQLMCNGVRQLAENQGCRQGNKSAFNPGKSAIAADCPYRADQ